MDVSIRLAKLEDLEDLVAMNEEFNGAGTSKEDAAVKLNESSEIVAIAFVGDNAIGFACAQSFTSFCDSHLQGEITEMYVREAFRGNGIACSLITCLEHELRTRGVKTIKILTNRNNNIAIKAYENAKYIIKNEVVLQKKIR